MNAMRHHFSTPADEIGFATEVDQLLAKVSAGEHKAFPVWAQGAIESQANGLEDDLAQLVTDVPATLSIQAQLFRKRLPSFIAALEGEKLDGRVPDCRETVLLDSLCAGLERLSSRAVVDVAPLERAFDDYDAANAVCEAAEAASPQLYQAQCERAGALSRALFALPAANLAQFKRKLAILLDVAEGGEPAAYIIASIRADAERLLL